MGKREKLFTFPSASEYLYDDELMNGWNVSAAQAPYQGQNVEEVEEGIDGEAVEGEGVEVMEQQFSEGLHEEDNHLVG